MGYLQVQEPDLSTNIQLESVPWIYFGRNNAEVSYSLPEGEAQKDESKEGGVSINKEKLSDPNASTVPSITSRHSTYWFKKGKKELFKSLEVK